VVCLPLQDRGIAIRCIAVMLLRHIARCKNPPSLAHSAAYGGKRAS
jgi:hypothetical protein